MARQEQDYGLSIFGPDLTQDVAQVVYEAAPASFEPQVSYTSQGHQVLTNPDGTKQVVVPARDILARRQAQIATAVTVPSALRSFHLQETHEGTVQAAWHGGMSHIAGDVINQILGNNATSTKASRRGQQPGEYPPGGAVTQRGEHDGTDSASAEIRMRKLVKIAGYTLLASICTSLVYNTISGIGAGNDEFINYQHPTHMFDAPAGDAEWVYHKLNWLPGMH